MSNSIIYLGVDVAKSSLDAFCNGKSFSSLPNTAAGHTRLFKQVTSTFPQAIIHLVCEATGGYEQELVRSAHSKNIRVSVVSPNRVRQFARACGILAKTDRIDAALIARFAESVKPSALLASSVWMQEFQSLVFFRQQHLQNLTRLTNQSEHLQGVQLKRSNERLIKALKRRSNISINSSTHFSMSMIS